MEDERSFIADELAKGLVRSQADVVAAAIAKTAVHRAGMVGNRSARKKRSRKHA